MPEDVATQPVVCRHCGEPIARLMIDGKPEDYYHPEVELSQTEWEDARYCTPSDETTYLRAEPA